MIHVINQNLFKSLGAGHEEPGAAHQTIAHQQVHRSGWIDQPVICEEKEIHVISPQRAFPGGYMYSNREKK